eukprot:Skav200423  [mRNA]  locus=scaffold260:179693:182733:- [translate_table: standard]
MQGLLIHLSTHPPPRVLNVVGQEMLSSCHHILVPLHTVDHSCAHLATEEGVFTVGLLCPAPVEPGEDVDGR